MMKEIKISQVRDNLVKLISKDWMLVTAGTIDNYNMMTASWGLMGEMWNHDVAVAAVRSEHRTREFIDREGRFTLTFFPPEMTRALEHMGGMSGHNVEKMDYGQLRAEELPTGQVTFSGARLVVECDVVYRDTIDPTRFADGDMAAQWYAPGSGGMHELYFGKIVRVWSAD